MHLQIHITSAAGQRRSLPFKPGRSVMQTAVDAGIEGIAADCGGCLSCATCHVYLTDPWLARLPAPSRDELAMLEMTAAERRSGSRLSCQIVLDASLDGLCVDLPDTQY